VDEKIPEKQLEFDKVKEKITKQIREEMARRKVTDLADDFYEKVYRSEQLGETAEEFTFEVKKAPSVTRAGGIPDIGAAKEIMDEAFNLRGGEVSKLIKSGDVYIIMKLLRKRDARLPELDEVRKTVGKDYEKEQAVEVAMKKAEEVLTELRKVSADPEEVARRYKLKWEILDPVSRTAGLVPRLGKTPQIAELLTSISKADPVFPDPIKTDEGVAVVRLVDTERATDAQYEKEREAFEKWIIEVRKTEFLKGWLRNLRENAEIDINKKWL
jgi:peptidyl-prolyl cis-trans isomerase D